eukprot:6181501-Pleurochrysis_carterae.AAC.2
MYRASRRPSPAPLLPLCLRLTRKQRNEPCAALCQAAQHLLVELARVNSEAQQGIWNEEHPTPGGGRLQLPKLSFSSERRQNADLFNW